MQIAFVIPAAEGPGSSYARRMVEALTGLGHSGRVLPTADATATLAALPGDCAALVDGMLVPGLLADRPWSALVHHLAASALPGEDAAPVRAAEAMALVRAERVVATSTPVAARLQAECGLDPARVAVVTPGHDDAPRSAGTDAGILAVGALAPRKGHDLLLRAVARLRDLAPHLTIAGAGRDPAHAAALSAQIDAAGLAGQVRLVADPDDATLEGLWRQAGIFALATRWEGYPVAVLQALRRGLPVVTTVAAGPLPAEAAAVCPVDDEANIGKALRRLLFDGGLRAAMGEAAWTYGRTLPDWATQARALVALHQDFSSQH